MSLVVLAVGGNALMQRGKDFGTGAQQQNLERACDVIASIAREHTLVLTHGNGPQVGILALRAEEARGNWRESLDVLGAETDGMIGYLLARELGTRLPDRQIASLLTQVEVDADDPAFAAPTKPIGSVYSEEEAARLAAEQGWRVARDGDGWRRVVSSPDPKRIVELDSIRLLIEAGHLVVAAGGGGVPVTIDHHGTLRGAEAVVDKDLTAALLASGVGADTLLLLTDASAIYRDWPNRDDPIRRISPDEVRSLPLPAGSMGPKAEAAARFAEASGGRALIGAIEDAEALMAGETGTEVAV